MFESIFDLVPEERYTDMLTLEGHALFAILLHPCLLLIYFVASWIIIIPVWEYFFED